MEEYTIHLSEFQKQKLKCVPMQNKNLKCE